MKEESKLLHTPFPRLSPSVQTGLTSEEVALRVQAGAHNTLPEGITPSVGKIITKNIFTLFNLINFVLALTVILVGHPRNAFFFVVALCNSAMGIFQELRSKRTLDKLSVLTRGRVSAIRNGQNLPIEQHEIVLDDILYLSAGNQICADAVVVYSNGLEVDESLLTGEADTVPKEVGSHVLSGSFVIAGQACIQVTTVGAASYANKLTVEAKKEKRPQTPLMRTLNNIIRVLTIAIVPIGAALLYTQYAGSGQLANSVLGASAAMIGMIPEGLILLTGVTLSVGAMKLARRKALVQTLPSIETLARVDVLCLDKTGTITDGTLSFEELLPMDGCTRQQAEAALGELMAALQDENSTALALRSRFTADQGWNCSGSVPFSSERKWSGAAFAGQGSYVLGAPGFVFPAAALPFAQVMEEHARKGNRVLCLAHSTHAFTPQRGLPPGLTCLALVVLSDTIRPEAAETFRFFEQEGVTLKVISGDDALTVSTIAAKAGIANAERYIDLSTLPAGIDLSMAALEYTVFGRVTPQQKRELLRALRKAGHTCCMTGDGVNDVLAMKEAGCSVSMIHGSDAARGASDFVLMTNDFSAMKDVLREGRRVINNIENVASLYLVKTIYSTILSLLYMFIPHPYPFAPLQMTPINLFTVGIPSFFLALRSSYHKPQGRFAANILENALPAAITVVFNIMVIQLAGFCFGLQQAETSTMNVLLTGAVGFILLVRIAQPLNKLEIALIAALATAFLLSMVLFGWFFGYCSLFSRNAFFYIPLLYASPGILSFLSNLAAKVLGRGQQAGQH